MKGYNFLIISFHRPHHPSTYPHGDGLVLPQAFMIGAIICNMLTFIPAYNFLCTTIYIEYSGGYEYADYDSSGNLIGRPQQGEVTYCNPLRLFRREYWDVEDNEQGYAGAAQAGAFFGAAATAIGSLTLVVLLKTICFQTSKCAIKTVIAMQATAALFSMLTLVAGATDLCKWAGNKISSNCKTERIRIEPGAGLALSATVFYLCAVISTNIFLRTRYGWENIDDDRATAEEEVGLVMVPSTGGHKNCNSSASQRQVAANENV